MLGTLYVVISSSKEEDYQKVKEELLEIYPDFSVSPYKESQMEKDAVEFFATCQITKEKAQEVLIFSAKAFSVTFVYQSISLSTFSAISNE